MHRYMEKPRRGEEQILGIVEPGCWIPHSPVLGQIDLESMIGGNRTGSTGMKTQALSYESPGKG